MQLSLARFYRRLAMFILALLLCATFGCGGPPPITGKWRTTTGGSTAMIWDFSKKGSVMVGTIRGKYNLDGNRIKVQTPFATSLYQIELKGDRMTLKDPTGSKLEFARVK